MRILFILLLLTSCAQMPENVPEEHVFKSREQKIIDCYKFVKTLGASDKFSGSFCKDVFEER